MIRHQHLYSLIFFLLSCLPLSAQQIKGTITDGETGETIPYASLISTENIPSDDMKDGQSPSVL